MIEPKSSKLKISLRAELIITNQGILEALPLAKLLNMSDIVIETNTKNVKALIEQIAW